MRLLLLLTALFCLLMGVSAETPLFAGCGTLGVLGNVLSGVLGTVSQAINTVVTGSDCQARCKSQGYKYSLFSLGLSLSLNTYDKTSLFGSCWCNNDGLQPATVHPGADSQGTCQTFLVGLIGVKVDYLGDNKVSFAGCKGKVAWDNTYPVTKFTVPTEGQCMTSSQCANKRNIVVRSANVKQQANLIGGLLNLLLGTTGGEYQCECSNAGLSGAAATCGSEQESVFVPGGLLLTAYFRKTYAYNTYTQLIPSSTWTRRHLRHQAGTSKYCHKGLTACIIPGTDEYECIDVSSNYESCGGCPAGEYGGNGTATGVDCTSLPHVRAHGAVCANGHCVATRCMPGRELRSGRCL